MTIARIFGAPALAIALWLVFRARKQLAETTLLAAWRWLLGGLLLWISAWSLSRDWSGWWPGMQRWTDPLWYATAVLMLCPPIAVLGSRRPGARVWTWFILVPLLFVLGWPALAAWRPSEPLRPVQLETPSLVGYGLVLVMGVGNYLGTRFTLPALLYAAALILLVAPFWASVPGAVPDPPLARILATFSLSGAALVALLLVRRQSPTTGLERVWRDFRNWFGIVWALRIQERVNATAAKEQWPARVEQDRILWTQSPPDPAVQERLDQTIRWLLRRFVDDSWIDRRMK